MLELSKILEDPQKFAYGVELVTTRGTMDETKAVRTRSFARSLADDPRVDWVSITDNAGGNPQLAPAALGKPILYAGKEVVIHLSCKDLNRNGLESAAWQLASEGFQNILALSGDYPTAGYSGVSKPVFDIDSIGLLTLLNEMNHGLGVPTLRNGGGLAPKSLLQTQFYLGAVVTNFKRHENEVVPQLLKLANKIECGAQFIIAQIGFDSRKSAELIGHMQNHEMQAIPLIGNVFLMSGRLAKFFHRGTIPGVYVSDSLLEVFTREGKSPDKGRKFFTEFAAKQVAIFKGLGFRGAYIGGVDRTEELDEILETAASFAEDDWKTFAREIQYPHPEEFYLYDHDERTGLSDCDRYDPQYEASLETRTPTHNVTLGYRFSRMVHAQIFTPGKKLFSLGKKLYESSSDPSQGPALLRMIEKASKSVMFGCHDCGDCSLPEIGYLCPESSCVKNQRNGPCGGTRDGKCEIEDFECIWGRTYDRLKAAGNEQQMLQHIPVIQDQSLRGTSSWGNTFRGVDHIGCNPHRLDHNDKAKTDG